ncbi:unnamed protein product [Acanthosepion pharaonis]|uniref:Uncharacterized protein n=1 Tax=Acanthosepion pharaonis TaxID=158019 RepID=A0A812DR15_ACAPH|nr:unnamed protein product [Sepia pharaonis]
MINLARNLRFLPYCPTHLSIRHHCFIPTFFFLDCSSKLIIFSFFLALFFYSCVYLLFNCLPLIYILCSLSSFSSFYSLIDGKLCSFSFNLFLFQLPFLFTQYFFLFFFLQTFLLFFFLNFINVSFFQFRSYISFPLSIFLSLYLPIFFFFFPSSLSIPAISKTASRSLPYLKSWKSEARLDIFIHHPMANYSIHLANLLTHLSINSSIYLSIYLSI